MATAAAGAGVWAGWGVTAGAGVWAAAALSAGAGVWGVAASAASVLEGDLRHPQIQYYENEKKNAIAPKITSKAKTAVQEQINTTILEKVADALTTAGSVFKAMGLDGRDIADGLLEKLSAAQRDMDELAQVLRSLQDVMDGADSLLAASALTITDARSTLGDASETVGSTVRLIGSGLDAADDASADLLRVLDAADDTLSDLEDMLGAVDMGPADDAAHERSTPASTR